MKKIENWVPITQIFANLATVLTLIFLFVQINQTKELAETQLKIERDKEIYNRTITISDSLDKTMSEVTLAMRDANLSDLDVLSNYRKAVRSMIILGVHLNNESIDKEIAYPLLGRHGLENYEKHIFKFIDSKKISERSSKENELILSMTTEMAFNELYLKQVRDWASKQRDLLAQKFVAEEVVKANVN
ncbi:hypothetical protein [Vibrio coralliilyticus]|uniref:hypothetical protein n=1 Tax=Vibrio coralliilyticus TaxID=190893 RepID=UPI002FD26F86